MLEIYTDGGSKGNPGPSAIGLVFYIDKKEVFRYREDIGVTTNNIAEYTALIRAFEFVIKNQYSVTKIVCYADSQLLVNQLNGIYKIKNQNLMNLVFSIRGLEKEINIPVYFKHVKRELNVLADALVNDKG